jgi:hypothetical protein
MTQQAQQRVIEAQVNLQKAEADLKESKIETAKEQLRDVREQGRKLKRELDAALAEFRRADAEATAGEIDRVAVSDQIREHLAAKPDAADFPSDEELRAWQTELDRLTVERDKAVARKFGGEQKMAMPRMRAIQLDQQLSGLRHRQAQLESLVRGEKISGWEGGISFVS